MKILFVQLGRYGDMILATPMFRAAKENIPGAEIYVLAGKHNFEILNNNPRLTEIYVWDKSPLKLAKLFFELRKHNFDYLIDPKDHPSGESGLIANMLRAETKVGHNPDGKEHFDIHIPRDTKSRQFTELCLDALRITGFDPGENLQPELFPSDDSKKYAAEFLKGIIPGRRLLINISASKESKMWYDANWVEFIKEFSTDYDILISSAPGDTTRAESIVLEAGSGKVFRPRRFEDVFAIVEQSDCVVTPDTSIVHVSAAFDKQLLALYSNIKHFYNKFHPLNSRYIVLKSKDGVENIKSIPVHEAITAFRNLMR